MRQSPEEIGLENVVVEEMSEKEKKKRKERECMTYDVWRKVQNDAILQNYLHLFEREGMYDEEKKRCK